MQNKENIPKIQNINFRNDLPETFTPAMWR